MQGKLPVLFGVPVVWEDSSGSARYCPYYVISESERKRSIVCRRVARDQIAELSACRGSSLGSSAPRLNFQE